MEELPATGKDYVATINSENLDAMRPYLADDAWDVLQEAVVVSLSGDSAENKLLGIQFAGS